jgi:hypothetical protein
MGNDTESRRTIQQILQFKDDFGSAKATYMPGIATLQATMNDIQGALNTINLMKPDDNDEHFLNSFMALKATTLADIAEILAEKNKKK